MISDPSNVLAEMARTGFPLWRPHSRSAAFRIQPLHAATPRYPVSSSVVSWLLKLDLVAVSDEEGLHAREVYIVTAEGLRTGRRQLARPTAAGALMVSSSHAPSSVLNTESRDSLSAG